MQKIRITFAVEFEPRLDDYEEGATIEDILRTELASAEEDPPLFVDVDSVKVTGEIVEV